MADLDDRCGIFGILISICFFIPFLCVFYCYNFHSESLFDVSLNIKNLLMSEDLFSLSDTNYFNKLSTESFGIYFLLPPEMTYNLIPISSEAKQIFSEFRKIVKQNQTLKVQFSWSYYRGGFFNFIYRIVYDKIIPRNSNDNSDFTRLKTSSKDPGTAIANYNNKQPINDKIVNEFEELTIIFDNFEEIPYYVFNQLGKYFPAFLNLDLKSIKSIPLEHLKPIFIFIEQLYGFLIKMNQNDPQILFSMLKNKGVGCYMKFLVTVWIVYEYFYLMTTTFTIVINEVFLNDLSTLINEINQIPRKMRFVLDIDMNGFYTLEKIFDEIKEVSEKRVKLIYVLNKVIDHFQDLRNNKEQTEKHKLIMLAGKEHIASEVGFSLNPLFSNGKATFVALSSYRLQNDGILLKKKLKSNRALLKKFFERSKHFDQAMTGALMELSKIKSVIKLES